MASEPAIKRAVAFVDGQNLFYAAKIAFGYSFPNYDVRALAAAICGAQGWQLDEVRFYTGIPDGIGQCVLESFLDRKAWSNGP